MAQVQVLQSPVLVARQAVVDELRELLAEAERGELVSFAYAYVTHGRTVVRGWNDPVGTPYHLIAGLHRCALEIQDEDDEG